MHEIFILEVIYSYLLVPSASDIDKHFFLFLMLVLGLKTQGLAVARQILYHLCHAPSPFAFVVFQIGPCVCDWAGLDGDLPVHGPLIAEMIGSYYVTSQLYLLVETGPCKLSDQASNLDPHHLPPQVARIPGLSHCTSCR
jgi:hypothetical protein